MNELKIPEGVEGDPDATEMIRVWIGNKDIHVSMLLGMWEEASNHDIDEREAWGELLGDIIRHIANGLTQSHDYNAAASEQRIANALLIHLGHGANTIQGKLMSETDPGAQRMRVHILGSGTCVPSLERYPSSILVEWGDTCILVDAGAGIMHRLLELGRSIDDIDAIFLSHFHLDHVGEVAPLLFSTRYPKFTRKKPLRLVGGPGLEKWFDGVRQAFGHTVDLPEGYFECMELKTSGTIRMGGLDIRYASMAHKPESLGFRFEDPSGFSLVYSGDTDETANLSLLAKGAHTLICECAMPEGKKIPGHLVPSLAGEMAKDAGVQRLVLTHFYPECQGEDMVSPCAQVFPGEVVLARDLMTL